MLSSHKVSVFACNTVSLAVRNVVQRLMKQGSD